MTYQFCYYFDGFLIIFYSTSFLTVLTDQRNFKFEFRKLWNSWCLPMGIFNNNFYSIDSIIVKIYEMLSEFWYDNFLIKLSIFNDVGFKFKIRGGPRGKQSVNWDGGWKFLTGKPTFQKAPQLNRNRNSKFEKTNMLTTTWQLLTQPSRQTKNGNIPRTIKKLH